MHIGEKSALDTAGTVAASQLLDLRNGDHVEVAFDGVLQGRSSNSELNSLLGGLATQQGVDQAAAEAVAAANAVNDAQLVLLAEAVLVGSNVVQGSAA